MRDPILALAALFAFLLPLVASEAPPPALVKIPHCFATARLSYSVSSANDGDSVEYFILMTSTIVSKSTLRVLCSVQNEPVSLGSSVRVPCKGGVEAARIEGPKSIDAYRNIGLRLPHTDRDILLTTSDQIDLSAGPAFQSLEYHAGKAFPCSSLQPIVDR